MASLTSAPPIGTPLSSGPPSLHGSPTLPPKSIVTATIADEAVVTGAFGAPFPKPEDDAATIEASPAPSVEAEAEEEDQASPITATPMGASVVAEVGVENEAVKIAEGEEEMKKSEDQPGEEESQEEEEESLEGLLGAEDEEDEEKCCKLCNRKFEVPRILSCLHVFCTGCIANLVEGGASGPKADFDDDDKVANLSGDDKSLAPETEKLLNGLTRLMRERKKSAPAEGETALVIHCPACQQETHLEPGKTVEALSVDHVMAAMVRVNASDGDEEPVCTSCKDQGKAEASCQDCASFLCSQCVTAHRFMRCFENHSVVALEDLCSNQGDGTSNRVQQLMHKTPLTCQEHPTEILKHFCHTCSIPICNECLIGNGNHRQPNHKSERIQDIEAAQKEHLQRVVTEGRSKVAQCQQASTSLESRLGDLQLQRDQVKGQIEEAFHSYKALLEQRREALLSELESSHKRQELSIMELFHSVEKTIEKIEDGAKFAQRIVDNGNAPAILNVKKLIIDQLELLFSTTPNSNLQVHLEFETNMAAFNEAVINHFGRLHRPPTAAETTQKNQVYQLNASGSNQTAGSGRVGFPGASPARPFGAPIVGRDLPLPLETKELTSVFLNNEANQVFAPGSARFRSSTFDDASLLANANASIAASSTGASNAFSNSAFGSNARPATSGAFTNFPNDANRLTAPGSSRNFKSPTAVGNAVVARGGAGDAGLLDADLSSLTPNQLTDYVQQMNDHLGGGALDVAGLPPGLLANLADGLAGTNLLSGINLESLLSILSPETAGVNAAAAGDIAAAATPQSMAPQQRPSQMSAMAASHSRGPGNSASPTGTLVAGDHRALSRNSHSPTISESGISMDGSSQSGGSAGSGNASIATRLGLNGANYAGNNDVAAVTQALFKPGASLGGVSVNNSGQICLNGQAVPGVNVNTLSGTAISQLLEALPNNNMGASGGISVSTGNTADPTHHLPAIGSRALSSGRGEVRSEVSVTQALINCGALSSTTSTMAPSSGVGSGVGGMGNSGNGGSGVLSNIGYFDPSAADRPSTPQMHGDFQDGAMVSPNGSGFGGSETGRSSANRQQGAGTGGNTFTGGAHPPYPVRGPNSKCQAMQIRHKFGTLGPGKCQFNSPHGFCLGGEENIVVADTNNHRIQVFDKSGEFKFQFGIPGRDEGQLWYPRKVAVLRSTGKYVVCDRGNERSRMQIFTKNGHFIRKIAIRYIDIVAGLAIAASGNIVAVDSVSPTVFVIAESGELVRWFDCSDYMREPSDIAVSGKEFFVCDFKGHCVVVFSEEGQFLRRIGCENITNFPNGIDISDAGDVLVGDSHGNRFHVAVFQRDGSLLSEFECPYVKVSRCCGLKITSEGYVVTLAKNNHHVLVLNTLYIT